MIEITIEGDTFTPTANLVVDRLRDFTEPLTLILADALLSAQEQIVEGKGSLFSGPTWDPMAASTVKKGRDPATLLVETGALVNSLTRGGDGNIFEVGPTEGIAGTGLTSPRNGYGYAAGQQEGSRNRPPRGYLFLYDERLDVYESWFANWIMADDGGSDA